MQFSSPWDQFTPATLEFCEQLLNGWIRQPANTWSSFGFVVIGALLWFRTPPNKAWLHIFAIGSILVGLTSAVFHSTMTFAAQFFDVSSMFITAGMLVILNAMRLGWLNSKSIYKALAVMQLTAMSLMYFLQGSSGEQIFSVQIFFIVLSEIYLIRRDRPGVRKYRWWIAAAISYALATLIWVADIQKFWCNPDNHWFNGHVVWHLLSALVVLFLYRFYDEMVGDNR